MGTYKDVSWDVETGSYQLNFDVQTSAKKTPPDASAASPFMGTAINEDLKLIGGFYCNPYHKEAQVFSLRARDSKPFGFLMKSVTAFSKDSGYSDEPWFKQAAVLSGRWALQNVEMTHEASHQPLINTDEVFNESISTLILDKEAAANYGIENVNQLDAQLFSLGFIRLDGPLNSNWNPGNYAEKRLSETIKNIYVSPLPDSVRHLTFLSKVFSIFIPASSLPLVRFFYFYQVIELLMEELSEQLLAESLDRLKEFRELKNSSLFRQEARTLQSLFKEDEKVSKLFTLIGKPPLEFGSLKDACSKSMAALGFLAPINAADGIYGIRNQIFHNYRMAGSALEQHLPEVNALLEVIVPDLLTAVLVEKKHLPVVQDELTLVGVAESELVSFAFSR